MWFMWFMWFLWFQGSFAFMRCFWYNNKQRFSPSVVCVASWSPGGKINIFMIVHSLLPSTPGMMQASRADSATIGVPGNKWEQGKKGETGKQGEKGKKGWKREKGSFTTIPRHRMFQHSCHSTNHPGPCPWTDVVNLGWQITTCLVYFSRCWQLSQEHLCYSYNSFATDLAENFLPSLCFIPL